jgi:hypothetical protein
MVRQQLLGLGGIMKMNELMIREVSIDKAGGIPQTLIVRYTKACMLGGIQDMISSMYKRPNTKSYIGRFIEVNAFVNLNNDPGVLRGMKWLSVVYECMEGNSTLSAKDRFPGSMIITVDYDGVFKLGDLPMAMQNTIQ